MRHIVVDSEGRVINAILLEEGAVWCPPEGCQIIEDNGSAMDIGGQLVDGKYTAPVRKTEAPPEIKALTPEEKLASVGLTVEELKGLLGDK